MCSVISLFLFLAGVFCIFSRSKYYIIFTVAFFFVCYQLFSWGFATKRFVDQILINQDASLFLVPHGGGVIGTDFLSVVLSKKVNFIFIKNVNIKTFEHSSYGEFISYDDEAKTLEIRIITQLASSNANNEVIAVIQLEE